ncbi:MAG: signal peptide peptidase SppA [Caldilineaceae bacterium]|nr:signal peptide peptidase SppA [Caldilineaceae bacterium]
MTFFSNLLQPIGHWLRQLLQLIGRGLGQGWQHFWCGVANLRRRLWRKQLPDYVVFTLDQALQEREPDTPWWYAYLPGRKPPLTLEALSTALERVAGDPAVKGVIFLAKSPTLSLAQAQSLAILFQRFRQWDQTANQPASQPALWQAKQIHFHLEQITTPLYVAACAADAIYGTPLTTWEVLGLRATPTFYKRTLDKLGITFDVVRVAPWKSAVDQFSRAEMSAEEAEQLTWLLDSWFADITAAIAQGRNLTPTAVQTAIDGAPWSATEAQQLGLLDGVLYEDELPTRLGQSDQPASLKHYAQSQKLLLRRPRFYHAQRIGVISLRGAIMAGESQSRPVPVPLLGQESLGSTTAQQQIRAAREADEIAAVVVHVDSPGGSALASDLIWRELVLLNQEKPVVIYMGDVAASGGYYIAAPGRKVVAQRATLTGSIGVVTAKAVTADAYAKIEAKRQTIQRGANANLYDDQQGWVGDQRAKVEQGVQQVYATFKERVAAGRHLPYETLDEIANGRVWTGAQALAHGLVDELGDFHQAVAIARDLAALSPNRAVHVEAITTSQDNLLAQPIAAISTRLGLHSLWQTGHLVNDLLTQEHHLSHEPYWLLADRLPRIR